MDTTANVSSRLKSGEFLIKESAAQDIFVPEEFTEEQHMMHQAMLDFIAQEIEPRIDLLDSKKDLTLMPMLLEKTGDLGFLGAGVPEEYGGFDVDFTTTVFSNEAGGQGYSFALTIGVQTSIGIAPLLLYGNAEQKAKYLPEMVTGRSKTCYCLTEPGAGSDANSGKTTATLSEDGTHYKLNGQKMWITNSGFADIFIVFAKIKGDANLSAFIVEKAFGGVSLGAEEPKMGIKGSSTRQIFFNEVPVPVENLLGERGGGFRIALNVLNTGRIKLASSSVGSSKKCIGFSVNYANERLQFGQPISKFGAIKHKLAMMAARTYAAESAVYRTTKYIDQAYDEMVAQGTAPLEAKYKCVEVYAMECAMLKVYASEVKGFVVDEGVQIYGGMGYSAETPVERMYRDARISRIFEGTNEINRMLSVDMLLKKAMKGKLDVMSAAMAVQKELMSIPSFGNGETGLFSEEHKAVRNMKKAILMVAGAAVQKLMQQLKSEQEILMNVADMLIQTYIFESTLLRTEKLVSKIGEEKAASQIEMCRIIMHDAMRVLGDAGRESIYAFTEGGDEQKMMLMGLKRFTKLNAYNLKNARRAVADVVVEANTYPF